MPADGLEAQDVVPGHFRRGDRFLGKIHTLARFWAKYTRSRAPSLAALPVITWRLRLATVMAGLWSVVAEAVVRACLTSVGIVRVLLRRLGLPRALCERGYRPSDRGHRHQRPAHHPGDIAAASIPTRSRLGQSERNARA